MLFAFQNCKFGGLGVKHLVSVSSILGLRLVGTIEDFSMCFSPYVYFSEYGVYAIGWTLH